MTMAMKVAGAALAISLACLAIFMIKGESHSGESQVESSTDELICALNKLKLSDSKVFDEVIFSVHRNGEESCGSTPSSLNDIQKSLANFGCSSDLDKFTMESFLTDLLASALNEKECSPTDDPSAPPDFYHYCDMGRDRTVIQLDHDKLVRTSQDTLPCRFFTREGVRISSIKQLNELAGKAKLPKDCEGDESKETCAAGPILDLYAVPAGRVFMFAPKFVGEIFETSHVRDGQNRPISLEVISTNPRVFDVHNFFSVDEAKGLIDKALKETSPTYALHRSTTGSTSTSVFNKRTSENAWDTHGQIASEIKRRCMSLLGFDEYIESQTDGLQVLRYNLTTAYIPHMDYLEDKAYVQNYDYESNGKGGNRFATILLYFSDLKESEGGETVFSRAWPEGAEQVPTKEAIRMLRESGDADSLKPGSWEEEMSAQCRTRLSIKPRISRAVLFYSQFPNGEQDPKSFHGGCPVLGGTKWAANLWAWNAPRPEYKGAPMRDGTEQESSPAKSSDSILVTFKNTGTDPQFDRAELFFDESGFFGALGPGQSVNVNTYETHRWTIMADGKVLKTFVIADKNRQLYEV